jgi:hypothetical protein
VRYPYPPPQLPARQKAADGSSAFSRANRRASAVLLGAEMIVRWGLSGTWARRSWALLSNGSGWAGFESPELVAICDHTPMIGPATQSSRSVRERGWQPWRVGIPCATSRAWHDTSTTPGVTPLGQSEKGSKQEAQRRGLPGFGITYFVIRE